MLLVLAVGMTYVIITAGIDLSVGAVLVFAGVVAAKAMNDLGGDGWRDPRRPRRRARRGLAWGMLNGLLVAKARDPPFDRDARARWAWRSARRC